MMPMPIAMALKARRGRRLWSRGNGRARTIQQQQPATAATSSISAATATSSLARTEDILRVVPVSGGIYPLAAQGGDVDQLLPNGQTNENNAGAGDDREEYVNPVRLVYCPDETTSAIQRGADCCYVRGRGMMLRSGIGISCGRGRGILLRPRRGMHSIFLCWIDTTGSLCRLCVCIANKMFMTFTPAVISTISTLAFV